jgi:reverse gyrase
VVKADGGHGRLASFVTDTGTGEISVQCALFKNRCCFYCKWSIPSQKYGVDITCLVKLSRIERKTAIVQHYDHLRDRQTLPDFGTAMNLFAEYNDSNEIYHGWVGHYQKMRMNRMDTL